MFLVYSCTSDDPSISSTSSNDELNVENRTSTKPCEFYCDGPNDEIFIVAVDPHPTKGCCYKISYNGVGGWTHYGSNSASGWINPNIFVPYEGKEVSITNHTCGSPQKTYWGRIHNGTATICTNDPEPLPYPHITLNIWWTDPQANVPVIIGCNGFVIGWPGEYNPDPYRDRCN